MSALGSFFTKVKDAFKTIGHDFKAVYTKLFGAQAFADLETTAENIMKSDLGQAALEGAVNLLAQVQTGKMSQASAISNLASNIVGEAKATGIQLETSIATMVASTVIARAQGLVNPPAAAAPAPEAPAPAESETSS